MMNKNLIYIAVVILVVLVVVWLWWKYAAPSEAPAEPLATDEEVLELDALDEASFDQDLQELNAEVENLGNL